MDTASAATTSDRVLQDQKLIDGIIRLASLASVRERIDPMLDTLRAITAKLGPNQPLNDTDRQQLVALHKQIKNYLSHDDPVRSFSEEKLDSLLEEDRQPLLKRHPFLTLVGVWLLGSILAMVAMALPVETSAKQFLAISFFWIGIHSGIAWFYLSSLSNFKAESRKAFGLIVTGTIITGLGTAHYPLVQLFHLEKNPWFAFGGLNEIFALASLFLYLGPRAFVRLLGIKTKLTDLRLMIGTSVGMCALVILAGRLQQPVHEPFYDLTLCCSGLILVWMTLGALLSWRATRTVTVQYTRGLRWYTASLALIGIGTAIAMIYQIFFVSDITKGLPIPIFSVFIVTELLMLQAGYTFKKYTAT